MFGRVDGQSGLGRHRVAQESSETCGRRMIGILFGISIFAGGLIMMWVHWNTWQAESDRAKTKGDRIFFIRKFRRRTLMGSMIAIIGAMMTTWFYADDDPRVKFVLVAGIVLSFFSHSFTFATLEQ